MSPRQSYICCQFRHGIDQFDVFRDQQRLFRLVHESRRLRGFAHGRVLAVEALDADPVALLDHVVDVTLLALVGAAGDLNLVKKKDNKSE